MAGSGHIFKGHNKNLLLYQVVCPVKYRRSMLSDSVCAGIVGVCRGIEVRYDLWFLEIGLDGDHVHFLLQGVPVISPGRMVQVVKSIMAREVFRLHPEEGEAFGAVSPGQMVTISIPSVNMAMKRSLESMFKIKERKRGTKNFIPIN